jgi:hypothetical protein
MKLSWKAGLLGCAIGLAAATTTASAETSTHNWGDNPPPDEQCCSACPDSYGWKCIERCVNGELPGQPDCVEYCNRQLTLCLNWCCS